MALTHRLHELGLLTEWGYRSTCRQLSRMGYRRQEPDGIPREASQLLSKLFRLLRDGGGGPGDIAADLGISIDELKTHVFRLTLTTVSCGGRMRNSASHGDLRPV